MTSGVEIAGLVLASIPLVVSALEHYSDGMSALERWWRYKREVNKVVRLLVAEQVLFQGTCERLLNAVVTPTELELLIELPGGARWKDSTLDQRLRRHLGRSYDSYMSCVEHMNAALTGLEARLELDPNGKPSWVDSSSFKSQIKRMQISFSRGAYQEALQRLEKNNSILAGLTAQNLELEPIRRRRRSAFSRLKYVQQHLVDLYDAMRLCWICGCSTQHHALLRLDSRLNESATRDDEIVYKGTFAQDELCFGVVFSTDHTKTTRWSWQETYIRPIHRGTEEVDGSKPEPETKISGTAEQKPNAKEQKRSKLRSLFSRRVQGHKEGIEPVPVTARKGVRFADKPNGPPVTCTTVFTPNAVPVIDLSPMIHDLCGALQAYQMADTSTSNDTCIGYLKCQKQDALAVHATRHITLTTAQHRQDMASLRQLVPRSNSFPVLLLSRAERFFLAMTVASAVLQLHDTPWLRERWTLDDILIHVNDAHDLRRQVYVSKSFPEPFDFQLTRKDEDYPGVRNTTLFALGIVLIELCLGQTLESMRNEHDPLDNMGRVNIVTEWATAKRMMSKVVAEAGNRYGDAVRRCIYCEFDSRDTNLNNERFREAVYQGVIAPLGDIFNDFDQPYEMSGQPF